MAQRKLIAFDADDLAVISTHLQDAAVRAGDIRWFSDEHRLVLGLERLDWDGMLDGQEEQRLISALRFERVMACQARGLDPASSDPVHLIGIEFESSDEPGGLVTLIFASGAAMRLEIECIECELADL
jgi:Protein of unknown function (DUF2948)